MRRNSTNLCLTNGGQYKMMSDYTSKPWGYYAPTGFQRCTLKLCRSLPHNWLAERLAVLLRRPIKYGRNTPLDVLVWGLKMRLSRRWNFSETALLFTPQFFDRYELNILKNRVHRGFVFLDLGANAGAYSFWVYSILGDECRIVAIEPDPEIYSRLVFNILANNASCIRSLNLALDDHSGRRTLYINPLRRGQNSLLGISGSSNIIRTEVVEVRTLPKIIEDEDIERIDAMKIDIEGMEYPVLRYFFEKVDRTLWPILLLMEFKETEEHMLLKERLGELGYTVLGQAGLNLILELTETDI